MRMDRKDTRYICGLFPGIKKIEDKNLRYQVIQTWFRTWKQSPYSRIEDVHHFQPAMHVIQYTNVDHTNQVCLAAEKIAQLLSHVFEYTLKKDHLLAAAILHDVDKLLIMDPETALLTATGQRIPHAVLSAQLAKKEGVPEPVCNIIRAHSEQSDERPSTIEAKILYYADRLMGDVTYLLQGLDCEQVIKNALQQLTK